MRKFSLLLVVVMTLALASSVFAAQPARTFTADLHTLNDSGVSGTATLTLEGDQLTVRIQASGLEPNEVHPQHIHGFTASGTPALDNNNRNATCPTEALDTNGDGLVDLAEGLPAYGPVILSLTPFPTAPNGTIDYQQTFTVDPKDIGPLQKRAIVLHGLTVDGSYVATMPVACGAISVMPGGPSSH